MGQLPLEFILRLGISAQFARVIKFHNAKKNFFFDTRYCKTKKRHLTKIFSGRRIETTLDTKSGNIAQSRLKTSFGDL